MPLSEADTHVKLIGPALHARGWTEDLSRHEETAATVEILEGRAHKPSQGRAADYTLRIKVTIEAKPMAGTLTDTNARND